MSANMLFVRPDDLWSLGATTTGTVDDTYFPQWLTDGRPGRPVRSAGGGLSLSISGPAGVVSLVTIHNHNLIVPVTIGGDVSAAITPAATRPPNGIQLDPFTLVPAGSPSSVADLTFAVSGNDVAEIVGEFLAGHAREVTPIMLEGARYAHLDGALSPANPVISVNTFDLAYEQRSLKGSQYYTTSDRDLLIGWWQAQRAGSRPSLLVPNPDVNDCWCGKLLSLSYEPAVPEVDTEGLWLVQWDFLEFARVRW